MHQILKRFRKIECGIEAEELGGSYRLKLAEDVGLRLRREGLPLETEELRFLKLRSSLLAETFSTEDAISSMKVSRTSAQRLLKWAAENNRVQVSRSGTGNSKIRFKFVA